jgi:cobalt transporter subunit CbtA
MIRRLFSSAILAGVLAGLVISLLYQFTTVPLIVEAEEFETKQSADARYTTGSDKFVVHLVHNNDSKSDHPEWEPASVVERIVYTSLTTIISGVGFALLVVSALVIRGSSGGFRIGVLWGIGGFAAFILAPAAGLPPELPGMMKAELIGRQFWWLGTAIVTATGLWILVFYKNPYLYILATVLLLAPHVLGAPIQHSIQGSIIPAELAAKFSTVSIGVNFIFWLMLGGLSAHFFKKFQPKTA